MLRYVCISLVIFSSILSVVLSDKKQDLLFAEYGNHGSKADFYSEDFLNGLQYSTETRGACKNLPKSWQNKAVSVDTKGTCIFGCDDVDCKGTCKYITPNNGDLQLANIGMSKKIVSFSGCFRNRS